MTDIERPAEQQPGQPVTQPVEQQARPATDGDGPVVFYYEPDLPADELAQMRRYVETANEARVLGKLSPTGRVGTKGALRRAASKAARAERLRAEAAGTPYRGQVGHAPDTTWTGYPVGFEWHDQTPRVNSALGSQASRYPVGYRPTEFLLEAGPDVPRDLGQFGRSADRDPTPNDKVTDTVTDVVELAATGQGRGTGAAAGSTSRAGANAGERPSRPPRAGRGHSRSSRRRGKGR